MEIAKENDRLLFIHFTGHATVGDRTAEFWPVMFADSRLFVENKMIICKLYMDDKTPLDSSDMIFENRQKPVSSKGQKNFFL